MTSLEEFENWHIKPNQGLGLLSFGMTPKDVGQYNAIYGSNPASHTYGHSADNFLSNLGEFSTFFSTEVLQGAQKAASVFDAKTAGLKSEIRTEKYYMGLEYFEDALTSISLADDCAFAHIQNRTLFSEKPQSILAHLQRLNGGAKIYKNDVIFDNLGIMLSNFYPLIEKNKSQHPDKSHLDDQTKSMTIFSESQINRYLTPEFTHFDFCQHEKF